MKVIDWLYLERLTGEQYLPVDVDDELHRRLASLVEDQVAVDGALIECYGLDARATKLVTAFDKISQVAFDPTKMC